MTSADIIRRQQRHVDQEFGASGWNWSRAAALRGRGGGVEQRGRRKRTKWSPAARRRPCPAAERGRATSTRRTRAGEGRRGCPGGPATHPRGVGGLGGAGGGRWRPESCRSAAGPGGGRRRQGFDFGLPSPIPTAGSRSSARQSWWRQRLASGWPESTARRGEWRRKTSVTGAV